MDVEQTQNKQRYRGKLYSLSDESAWEDMGTGYVSIIGPDESRMLIFRDEESGEVLHDRPVHSRDTYQLQGEGDRQTIIVWEDPDTQKDFALSFQDPDGTTEVWDAIRKEPGAPDEKRLLPLPNLGTLAPLSRMLTCVPPSQREALAAECMAPKFITGLVEAFHTAEDLGSAEQLAQLWQVAKGIFLLSNQKLTERYLQRDIYEDMMGMLEYDDGLPAEKRIAHRQVLTVKVQFQHVVTFEDAETLERIHLNYRLQYLKDIVLPRILDDQAFVSLTQMIHGNLSVILDHIQKNASLLERLLTQIQQKDTQALLFLQDVCRLAKMIPPGERQALYDKMIGVQGRLFEVLCPFLADVGSGRSEGSAEPEPLHPPRHLVVEVLLLSALNDPSHLRRFLTSEGSLRGRAMLTSLIQLLHIEADQGVQGQIAELLRSVMDPATLEHRERDGSLDVFYERGGLDELVAPLRVDGASPAAANTFCFAQQLVCELLAFAVTNHGYRARVYVMRHGLAQQAAHLMAAPHRFLQLAPVRLIRAMVMTKDDAYHRYIMKSGLFTPLMRNLQLSLAPPALGSNLLVSATLELLEFIRIQNIKTLVDHVCRKHAALLQEYAPKFKTMEGLLLKHQQNLEYEAFPPEQHAAGGPISRASASGPGGRGRVLRSPGRGDSDDDDEAYFDSVDDDDEDAGTSEDTGGGGSGHSAEMQTSATRGPGVETTQQSKDGPVADGSSSPGLRGLLGGYEDDDDEEGDEEQKVAGDVPDGTSATKTVAAGAGQPDVALRGGADGDADVGANNAVAEAGAVQALAEEQNGVGGREAGAEQGAGKVAELDPSAKAEGGDESGVATVDASGGGVVSEKALNHVPKRLKTSTAT